MRVVVHRRGINYMMSPVGPIGRASRRAAGKVRDRAKENAPVDLGLLRNSIVSERQPDVSPTRITFRIGSSVEYAIYQELGTGPIFARRAPFLVFRVKSGAWVTTYSTRGVPAVRYLTRAIDSLTVLDFRGGLVE